MIESVRRQLRGEIARGAIGTFGLKGFQTGVMFLISLGLARLLGPDGYGAYSFAMSWVNILLVPAMLGLQPLLVRNVAAYQTTQEWGLLRGLLRRTNQWVALASLAVVSLAYLLSWLLSGYMEPQMLHAVWVALALVPVLAQQRVRQSIMRALHNVVTSQVPEVVIQPLLFGTFLASSFLIAGYALTAPSVAGLRTGAAIIALAVILIWCRNVVPKKIRQHRPLYRNGPWFRGSLSMLWHNTMGVFTMNVGTLLVGFLAGAESAGIYSLVNLIANLIAFAMASIDAPLAPSLSRLYVRDDIASMQRLMTKAARFSLLATIGMAAIFAIGGEWALSLIHPRFAAGYETLLILCAGKIVLSSLGSVGAVLVTTGDQRITAMATTVSAALTTSLCFALIPVLGINGAAIAMVCGPLTAKLIMFVRIYRRLGLDPTAIGFNRSAAAARG